MENVLNSFEGHIPDNILKGNNNLDKLLKVLNGMLELRRENVDTYARRYLHPLVSDISTMRRYVDQWDAEYTENSSRPCLDCLYRNYFDIYSSKGTLAGIKKLLKCLFWVSQEPTITIDDFDMGKPLILFDDNVPNDYLPNGQDLANEVEAASGEELWVPTLLDDSWLQQQSLLNITINAGYAPTQEFLEFIKSVIVLYLPMVSENFIIINLNIT
tara:strand:+ start:42709 stop:43353 length:645 start_codon:yes stop_codon:yes gene_type:complete